VKELLKKEMGMTEDRKKNYCLMHGGVPIDLLPFGKIAEPGSTVCWPGQFRVWLKVQGFQEAFDNAAEIVLKNVKVRVVIPEMLVALKLSSWSLGSGRAKDAMDIRLILENVKLLCPDLEDDFHNDENEALFEKYSNDENGLWLSSFGSRILTLLGESELSEYLKNLINSKTTLGSLIRDMNEGNVAGQDLEKVLMAMVAPLKDGLMRK
jgi:hypothetical protein